MNAARTVAAARVLCARHAEACNVDNEDLWKVHGADFLADAHAALEAADKVKLPAADTIELPAPAIESAMNLPTVGASWLNLGDRS